MTSIDETASFWEHLDALRSTLFQVLLVVLLGTALAFLNYPHLLGFLTAQAPTQTTETTTLINSTGGEAPLILLSPIEGMVTVLKVSFWAGLIGSSPLWVYLVLRFVLPALTQRERTMLLIALPLALGFFLFGVWFAFVATLPIAVNFLYAFNAQVGVNLWSLAAFLDFAIWLSIASGLAFVSFAILLLLVHYGVVAEETLREKRRPVIVGVFVAAAVLTPPDVLTQCLLAGPMLLFYEITILYARLRCRKKLATQPSG